MEPCKIAADKIGGACKVAAGWSTCVKNKVYLHIFCLMIVIKLLKISTDCPHVFPTVLCAAISLQNQWL